MSSTVSLESIESAIKQIDVKKEQLKQAFDHLQLQANSSHLSSFSLSWPDLDSHFSALQHSLTQRFRLLTQSPDSVADSLATRPVNQLEPPSNGEQQPSSSNTVGLQPDSDSVVVTRPELNEFCERMDGKGLRKYINEHQKEREAIRLELHGALKAAPDPGAMVLDAMEGFFPYSSQAKGPKDPDFFGLRRVCLFLLEQLMETGLSFSDQVREKAKVLALDWKGKLGSSKDNSLETLAFLHLLAAYGLEGVADEEELVGYFVVTARHRQATMLCRSIGLGEKVHDVVQKLLDSGKQLLAVRFVFEFGLVEKFPPIPLLKHYLKETKNLAKQLCKDGKNSLKSQNEATAKELSALKAVIKVIEEHKLESEYSPQGLVARVAQLEKQQADRKRPAAAPAAKPQQQAKKKKQAQGKHQQSGNKRPRTASSAIPSAASLGVTGTSSSIPPFQQSHLQPTGLLPDHSAAYLNSPAGPYGTPVAPYAGSSAGLYGLAGNSMSFPANPNPAAPHLYSYDRLPSYNAYGLPPQFHPSYYPQ